MHKADTEKYMLLRLSALVDNMSALESQRATIKEWCRTGETPQWTVARWDQTPREGSTA